MTLLTVALTALLQTVHPCDAAIVPNVNTKVPFSVGFCWNQKDIDGVLFTVTELQAVQVKLVMDGVVVSTVPLPPTGAGSSAGFYYYTIAGVTAAKGSRVVAVIMSTSEDAAPSTPYAFRVVGAPPSSATQTQVTPKP